MSATHAPELPLPAPPARPVRYRQQLRDAAPWVLLLALLLAVWHHYLLIGTNFATKSLPNHLFVTLKQDRVLARGDYVTFTWHGGGPYPRGMRMTKIVAGVPGDVVTAHGSQFYVNGQPVATAKPLSKAGKPLEPGPVGVIPHGHYFVLAPHVDSLDSRYALMGWIRDEQVVGRAVAFF